MLWQGRFTPGLKAGALRQMDWRRRLVEGQDVRHAHTRTFLAGHLVGAAGATMDQQVRARGQDRAQGVGHPHQPVRVAGEAAAAADQQGASHSSS